MSTSPVRVGRLGWLAAALFGGVCGAALVAGPHLVGQVEARPIAIMPPAGAPMSFADLIDRVSPAVVSLTVVVGAEESEEEMSELMERFRNFPGFEDFLHRQRPDDEDRPREGRSLGSGFFISADGYLITNNHVVENAKEITVTTRQETEFKAEVVGRDEATDLAVLKIVDAGTTAFPYVLLAKDAGPRIGDWVVAVGNPFGLGHTATAGIVSANQRALAGGGSYTDFVQIDASINRGNSGGPTFDLTGRVVGVNTAILSPSGGSVGIGFMIPADLAASISDQLIRNGRVVRGWLGVSIQDVTEEVADARGLRDAEGALVAEVVAGGPAEAGGFRRGDIILTVNGQNIKDGRDLTRKVGLLAANSRNAFEIHRDGRRQTLQITIAERPSESEVNGANEPDERGKPTPRNSQPDEEGPFGARYRPLDEAARTRLGLGENEQGLVLSGIGRSGVLADLGLENGQALLEANGRALDSVATLEAVIAEARAAGRRNVLLAVRLTSSRTAYVPASIVEDEQQ